MRKTLVLISSLLSGIFISAAAYATQINLQFADDFQAHQDKLNASVDAFYNGGENKFNVQGLAFDNTAAFAAQLATMFAGEQLVSPSKISLGMINNGTTIAPASCQNIDISNVNSISILLSETGCTIS